MKRVYFKSLILILSLSASLSFAATQTTATVPTSSPIPDINMQSIPAPVNSIEQKEMQLNQKAENYQIDAIQQRLVNPNATQKKIKKPNGKNVQTKAEGS